MKCACPSSDFALFKTLECCLSFHFMLLSSLCENHVVRAVSDRLSNKTDNHDQMYFRALCYEEVKKKVYYTYIYIIYMCVCVYVQTLYIYVPISLQMIKSMRGCMKSLFFLHISRVQYACQLLLLRLTWIGVCREACADSWVRGGVVSHSSNKAPFYIDAPLPVGSLLRREHAQEGRITSRSRHRALSSSRRGPGLNIWMH